MRSSRSSRGRLDRGHRMPSIYSRTETQEVKKRSILPLIFFFALMGGTVYFVLFSPFFKIKSVTVGETRYADRENINKIINDYRNSSFFYNNILFFSAENMKNKLIDIEGIKDASVVKEYPATIKVELQENVPVFVWETIGKKYMVDESGAVWGDFEDKYKDMPMVVDSKNVPVKTGDLIVPKEFPKFLTDLYEGFTPYTNQKIVRVEVPEITSEVKVVSNASWYVLFDTTKTAKNQLINLSRVLSEAKSKKKNLQYVDLRIDNRIFYK